MNETGPSYANVRIGLRAPRVAVVFEGGEQWHYWARLALHAATGVWGGQGFILIPHEKGLVGPPLLRAATVYDPDYVVLLTRTIGQYEAAYPKRLKIFRDERLLEGTEREAFLGDVESQHHPDPPGEQARTAVAAACNPHRRRLGTDRRWDEDLRHLSLEALGTPLTRTSDVRGAPQELCLSAPPGWDDALGVACAAKCGLLEPPSAGTTADLTDGEQVETVRWLLDAGDVWTSPPMALVAGAAARLSVDGRTLPFAFGRSTHGLTRVSMGVTPRHITLVVIGDTADDFALALAWDRLYGRGVWLPSEWWPTGDSEMATASMTRLASLANLASYRGDTIQVTTTSAHPDEVDKVAQALRTPLVEFLDDAADQEERRRAQDAAVVTGPMRYPRRGVGHLGVVDQFDQQYAIPVQRDDDGGLTMAAPPPAPVITHPDLAQSDSLAWQVDVDFWPALMPRGRGLDGHALLTPDEDQYLTWVRSGRDGIAYNSHRFNFVAAGTPRVSRLARPRLRELNLFEWVRARATQENREAELSDAGRRVDILRRLWGSRERLAADIAGPMLPAFRAFQTNAHTSAKAFPLEDGVVLAREGYLSFAAMTRLTASSLDMPALRQKIDELLSLRVLRRGVIVDCGECERPAFIALDDLRQTNACARCGARNELAQPRWRQPEAEPNWYYDLHPALRELLSQHGEVPLLLAWHLRTRYRRYSDVAELNLRNEGTNKPLAESDLIATCDDELIIAEAKSVSTLAKSHEISRVVAKRVLVAAMLQADQVVLATTEPTWADASVDATRQGLLGHPWPDTHRPALRLITGLGSDEPVDSHYDLDTGQRSDWADRPGW